MYAQVTDVGLFAHAVAAVGFAVLAVSLLWRREQTLTSLWLNLACCTTAVWAVVYVFAARFGAPYMQWLPLAETLRTASWIVFLVSFVAPSWRLSEKLSSSFVLAVGLGFVFAFQVLADVSQPLGWTETDAHLNPLVAPMYLTARLAFAIGGLVLVHNVYVNASPSYRWGIRMLCIGLGGLFAYDLNIYTLASLSGEMSTVLVSARGIVNVLIVPLVALSARRNRLWQMELQVSRQVVFQSLSLIGVGIYLMVMAAAAYGLKLVGGNWGSLLQVSFLFATVILAVVVLFSGRARAWAKVKINKHFFAYKYDYREEWLRFIATLSGTSDRSATLHARVIKAVCDIVDSPGGALWLPDEDGALTLTSRWNYRTAVAGREPPESPLFLFASTRKRTIDFNQLRDGEGDYDGLTVPDWALEDSRAWLGVPLIHLDKLAGLLIVEQPRAPRSLNWEDFDLLRTVGRQAASYLAEQVAEAALLEARKFEEFNRRFAFIMHDIKNLVSQLSLISRNAQKHAGNPEFQKDMILTIQDSVGKMNDMLARLQQHNTGNADQADQSYVNVAALVAGVVRQKQAGHALLTFESQDSEALIYANEGRLEQVFSHLLQNAVDASAEDAPIRVDLACHSDHVQVMIEDRGSGMSEDFIRNSLFKPFQSTKAAGFGIGAYEAREIVRSLGGRLDVRSELQKGSTFTVYLPLAQDGERAVKHAGDDLQLQQVSGA